MASPATTEDEYYVLELIDESSMNLYSYTFIGMLRGLETFSQLFETTSSSDSTWTIPHTPIIIKDSPDYIHRGLMIDSARHFLSIDMILKTIDSMMYNKLNVLHWHITDTESFPFPLHSFPNITTAGAYTAKLTYSFEDIKRVIDTAMLRGISVIPEVDSPGHALSWAK